MGRVVVVVVVLALLGVVGAQGGDLAAIGTALSDAEAEVRGSIFPAIAGVFGALVLIGVAGMVVSRIARGN